MTAEPASKIPEAIWRQFRDRPDHGAFAIRTRDGRVVGPVAVRRDGTIGGLIVGGQDGVIDLDPPLAEDDILAIRVADGILGTFGLTPWRARKDGGG